LTLIVVAVAVSVDLQGLEMVAGSCAGRTATVAHLMAASRGEYTEADIKTSFLFHMKEVCTRGKSADAAIELA
jgi:hypothetical protein